MRLRHESNGFSRINENDAFDDADDEASVAHRKTVRKRLEEKLEARRLRHELDDFDEEDHWE